MCSLLSYDTLVRTSGVQEKGCMTMYNLAFNCDTFKETIACAGGIESIIAAMQMPHAHVLLQQYACSALLRSLLTLVQVSFDTSVGLF